MSSRAISKVRLQEHGAQSAENRLVKLGATPRPHGQHPAEWIDNILASDNFRKVRHPGNHIYAWALGNQRNKAQLIKSFAPHKTFPKKLDSVQTDFDFDFE